MHHRIGLLLAGIACGAISAAEPPVFTGDFWKADKAFYGDGRRPSAAHRPTDKAPPHGFVLDYRVEIPETGWYSLFFHKGSVEHDLNVDGKIAYIAREVRGGKGGLGRGPSVQLEKGSRLLRLKRTGRNGFPMQKFDRFELRKTEADPAFAVSAEKTGHDALRVGEKFAISMTAGGIGKDAVYEFTRTDLKSGKTEPLPPVRFGASAQAATKVIEFPCDREGIFRINAATAGKPLSPAVFRPMIYAVVDTAPEPAVAAKPIPVVEIDCVKQTINGKPIAKSDFAEANGPTRISESPAGRYRESHDGTAPEATGSGNEALSGFGYRFTLPAPQVPYLMEVEYPDDARRTVTIGQYWFAPGKDTMDPANHGYQGKAYETGGFFPVSNQMKTHRMLFWAMTGRGNVHILNQYTGGVRAAASKIRIYRFPDDRVPGVTPFGKNDRLAAYWYEEGDNFRIVTGVMNFHRDLSVRQFEALKRICQLTRFYGGNAFSGVGASYQGVFWRSKLMEGFSNNVWHGFEQSRLALLFCEKYGMKYIPEYFGMQGFLNNVHLAEGLQDPAELHSMSCTGAARGGGVTACDVNPLHPVVQNRYIAALGELADSLRDSPAFGGITVRSDSWGFKGEFFYPSLYWGYGVWTAREFEKDTGIKVPNHGVEPADYAARFQFLTAPAMREKWIAWRNARIADYHKRLVKRIRGGRSDVFFGIAGSFDCDYFERPEYFAERARGCGIELDKLAGTGVAVIPVGRYGSREAAPGTRAIYDAFFRPDNVQAGRGEPRAFASYFTYMELASWPAAKLGIPPVKGRRAPYYCSSTQASGRNALERYAAVIAEQDTAYLREGGNADSFCDPEILRPFLTEYRAIPNVPFDRAPGGNDPVAVWSVYLDGAAAKKAAVDPGLYFYAVNKERVPATVRIALANASNVRRLTCGTAEILNGGVLTANLPEFGIRAWRVAPGGGGWFGLGAAEPPRVTGADSTLPEPAMRILEERMAAAQNLRAGSTPEFRKNLDAAWNALRANRPWEARAYLNRSEMLRAAIAASSVPTDQLMTTFPAYLKHRIAGHYLQQTEVLTGLALAQNLRNAPTARPADGAVANPLMRGDKLVWSETGAIEFTLDIPAEGEYRIALGLVARDAGMATLAIDGKTVGQPLAIREPGVPGTAGAGLVKLLPGKRVFSLRANGPVGIYALEWTPKMKPIAGDQWKVAGPFPGEWGSLGGHGNNLVKTALAATYPAETRLADNAVFDIGGKKEPWRFALPGIRDSVAARGVDMANRVFSTSAGIDICVTRIYADRDRTALLYLSPDWWAVAALNGEKLVSNRAPQAKAKDGAEFMGNRCYHRAPLKLKKGENVLVVKQHGGSLGSALCGYITDDPGIVCRAAEKEGK